VCMFLGYYTITKKKHTHSHNRSIAMECWVQ
jgi:hypothetical protein